MGEVEVPAEALWRAQTQRAVQNFPISGRGLEPAHIRALAQIKGAAAQVNADLGRGRTRTIAGAIAIAAAHVADGGYDDQFPVDVFQTGSGTSSNMNANEVIATLATRELGRDVHPNDHVNASQSSNDVFPSSIHLAATQSVDPGPGPGAAAPRADAALQGGGVRDVVKAGRTHLMDATPVTLGQEFSGYATQVRYGVERMEAVAAPAGRAAARRHRGRHRDQHPAGLRPGGDREAARADRRAADRGAQPLRGAGRAGRAGGDVRPAPDDRGRSLQDRQRHPLDGLRPPRRPARAADPRPPARLVDHARARSTRWSARRSARSAPR